MDSFHEGHHASALVKIGQGNDGRRNCGFMFLDPQLYT